jgi:hypothetical protein
MLRLQLVFAIDSFYFLHRILIRLPYINGADMPCVYRNFLCDVECWFT